MLLKIHVRPNAKEWKVIKKAETEWIVYVPEPPVNDRANRALLKFLRKEFQSVRLVRGRRSRLKLFEVS